MTTNITISTNGDYVSEGYVISDQTWDQNGVENYARQTENFKIGPGNMVSRSFSINHGAEVRVSMTERDATPEEIEAAKGNIPGVSN